MEDIFKSLASYGPIGVVCGLLVAGIVALWRRVISMQAEILQIAREAVAAQRDTIAELRLARGAKGRDE